MKEELEQRYKSYSNEQLLDIIEFSAGYTAEAMAVAQVELNNRQLTEEDLAQLRIQISEKEQTFNEFEKVSKLSEEKVKSFLNSIKSLFSKDEIKKAKNIVKILLIVSWFFYLYYFLRNSLPFFLYDIGSVGKWDLYTLLFFFGELFTPIMLLFLALKFKSGWYMFFFNSLLLVFSSSLNLFYYYYYFSVYEHDDMLSELMNVMNPNRPYLQLYFNLLLSSGMLWAIRLKQVRAYFGINRTGIIISILITILTILGAFTIGAM
jgi:hypothetical protein